MNTYKFKYASELLCFPSFNLIAEQQAKCSNKSLSVVATAVVFLTHKIYTFSQKRAVQIHSLPITREYPPVTHPNTIKKFSSFINSTYMAKFIIN